MKQRSTLAGIVTVVLTTLVGSVSHAQTSYAYADLGAMTVLSMNNLGQVVGSATTLSGVRAVRITPLDTNSDGKPDTWYRDLNSDGINDLFEILPIPAGYSAIAARAINLSGAVTGYTGSPLNQPIHTPSGGAATAITTKGAAYGESINDTNVIAGRSWDKRAKYLNATTWKKVGTSWTQTWLGAPAGYLNSTSVSINNAGAVAGRAWPATQSIIVPVVWLPSALYSRPQGWTVLAGLGGIGGDALGINSLGQLAGSSNGHAVLWLLQDAYGLASGVHDLHTVESPYVRSTASSLNQAPIGLLTVVGSMDDLGSDYRAFVWKSDTMQMTDLNAVTSGIPVGLTLGNALAVSDSGLILGRAYTNPSKAFVLVPSP